MDDGLVLDEDENTQIQSNGIEIINLDEEEVREIESVAIALRNHQKGMKYLWKKYSNSTNQV